MFRVIKKWEIMILIIVIVFELYISIKAKRKTIETSINFNSLVITT